MKQGILFDIQRYSTQDGPGIRTTVFFKGCPLSCGWCHNPESRRADPEVWMLDGRCNDCGRCLDVCPSPPADGKPGFESANCVRCGGCVSVCPSEAREVVGKVYTVKEVMREVGRDREFYEESGGGVTFSGGEPLLQPEFLEECLRSCKKKGYHTVVDTSGHAPRETLLEIARWTDLFLYDLKIFDDDRHQKEIGVPAAPIRANLRALDEAGASVWVRLPLIPRVNDDTDNLDAIAHFVAGLGSTRRLHILPYHATGEEKRQRFGDDPANGRYEPPSRAALDSAADLMRSRGLDVLIGG
jgi:pyruvate formate lyase activating enzyme